MSRRARIRKRCHEVRRHDLRQGLPLRNIRRRTWSLVVDLNTTGGDREEKQEARRTLYEARHPMMDLGPYQPSVLNEERQRS